MTVEMTSAVTVTTTVARNVARIIIMTITIDIMYLEQAGERQQEHNRYWCDVVKRRDRVELVAALVQQLVKRDESVHRLSVTHTYNNYFGKSLL